ncbi:transcriptional regulator FtsR [Epidermidibacterium keratini]|uniref:transcriptional regulator FtsR n=1 Tax=Epidermidibacterium keratini TaxID=1891644 RepID=UPI00186596FD|nr:MerR family transcriptional regulator [Epidermidibacterium keratini]
MTSGGNAASEETISIGELRAALLPDFPDISISKIRYLEDVGLIQPARTKSSYRKFSHADLARVRYVLTMQREHFLPLKVIRENLEAMDRGLEVTADRPRPRVPTLAMARDRDGMPTAEEFAKPAQHIRISRAELIEQSGIDEQVLESMEQYGVITPERGGMYDADAFEVAQLVASMAEYGLEARHLRSFRTQADREIGLFAQVVTPMMRHKTPQSRGKADETMRELAALSVRLHAVLVRSGLRRQVNS